MAPTGDRMGYRGGVTRRVRRGCRVADSYAADGNPRHPDVDFGADRHSAAVVDPVAHLHLSTADRGVPDPGSIPGFAVADRHTHAVPQAAGDAHPGHADSVAAAGHR